MKVDKVLNLFIIVLLILILAFLYMIIYDGNEVITNNHIEENNVVANLTQNKVNKWEYSYATSEDICKLYFYQFIENLVYYPEEAYDMLDKEYREKKFENIQNFKQYIEENREMIKHTTLDKYKISKQNEYKQYTCIDKNENYYIIRETASMQYTVMLDTYTIDLPEFTKKYNNADEQTKVGMNIEKIIQALNAKDYGYVYGKLADGFKSNYFSTVEVFENYMKNNFYDKNIVTYNSFKFEGQNYIYTIEIEDANNSLNPKITKNIIMQLKDRTDFVFSFNV